MKKYSPVLFPHPYVLLEEEKFDASCTSINGLHSDHIWTEPVFTVVFSLESTEMETLDIVLRGWRPEAAGPVPSDLRILLNGRVLEIAQQQKTFIRCQVEPGTLLLEGNILRLEVTSFVPEQISPGSGDSRQLGLDLEKIVLH